MKKEFEPGKLYFACDSFWALNSEASKFVTVPKGAIMMYIERREKLKTRFRFVFLHEEKIVFCARRPDKRSSEKLEELQEAT
jgi:hypothetical protein